MGNTQSGDGTRYKGRGPIQLTGRANYRSASGRVGADVEADPERVCMPSMGFKTTVDFWTKNSLNNYCKTGSSAEFKELTRRINGGYNGLEDRQAKFAKARTAMGC